MNHITCSRWGTVSRVVTFAALQQTGWSIWKFVSTFSFPSGWKCALYRLALLAACFLAADHVRAECTPDQTIEIVNGEVDDIDGVVGITQAGTIVTCVGAEDRQVTTTFDPDVIQPGPPGVTVNILPGATLGSPFFIPVLLTGTGNTIDNLGTVGVNGDGLLSLAIAAAGGTIDNKGTILATGTDTSGIGILGDLAELLNGGSITVGGFENSGMELEGNGGQATNSGSLTMNGGSAIGISAVGDGAMLMNSGTVNMNGGTAIGIAALGTGAVVSNGNTIETNAVQALGMGAVGQNVNVINAAGATVETRRDQSFGLFIGLQSVPAVGLPVQVADPAQGALTNDGMVITDGDGSDGMHGFVSSAVISNNGTVNAQGDNSYAIDIIGSSAATTIGNAGTLIGGVDLLGLSPTRNSGGISLDGKGNITNQAGASLLAFGEAAVGIRNTDGDGSTIKNFGSLKVDSSINPAAGYGIDVAGNDVVVQNGKDQPTSVADSAELIMKGDNSAAIRTRGTGAVVSNSTALTIVGNNNRAIDVEIQGNGSYWVDNDGVISLNDEALNPGGGANSVGIYVRNADINANLHLAQAQNSNGPFCVGGGPAGAQILNCGTIFMASAQNATAMHVEGISDSFVENQGSIFGTADGQKGILIDKALNAPDSDGQGNLVTNFTSIDLAGSAVRGIQVSGNGNLVFNGSGITDFAFVPGVDIAVVQAFEIQESRNGVDTQKLTSLGQIRVNGPNAVGIDVFGNSNLLGNRLDLIDVPNPPPFDPNIPPENRPGFVGFSEIRATGANSIGVRFLGSGNVFDNQGIVEGQAFSIFGSQGRDVVQNQNRLIGNVNLSGGSDLFIQVGSSENIEGTVNAGEAGGQDALTVIASTAPLELEESGTVQRTIIDGDQFQDFETLVISNGAAERGLPPVPAPPQGRAYLRNELNLDAADGAGTSTANINGTELIFEDNASLVADQITVGLGSRLSGNGSVGRKVFNLGQVESSIVVDGAIIGPGNSPGRFEFFGDVFFDGVFEIEFAGTAPGEFDIVEVFGDLEFGDNAVLDLIFIDGFAPQAGDQFDFLLAENLLGDLANVELNVRGLLPGFDFDLGLTGSGLTLTSLIDTSAVPVPGAVWLFGTALVGLFGFGKRKNSA